VSCHSNDGNAPSQLLNIISTALTLFGGITHDEAIKPMKAALENGATFWNAVRPAPKTLISNIG